MSPAGVEDCFRTIVVVDFEYEIDDGDLPHVLCLVAYVLDANLRHVDTIRRWRGEFGSTPPFDIGPDTLVVGYSPVGRDDVLPGARLEISDARLRSAHGVSRDQQHPVAVQSGRGSQEAAQAAVGRLPRLRHRGLGEHRQAGDGQGDRRGPLARIRPRGGVAILRGGRPQLGGAVAASDRRSRQPRSRRSRNSSCAGASTAPSPSPGSRRAACRSTWSCGTSCRRTSRRSSAH